MRSITLATLLVLAISAPAVANAQAKGDAEAGKRLAYTCTGCHGIIGYKNVYPSYHVPRISGQNYEYLVAALTAYQAGTRKHPTMTAQAQSMNAQDIANIASYLAAPPTP